MVRTAAVKQSRTPNFDTAFGDEFSIKDYSEKEWEAVYYAIRELHGWALKKAKTASGESFAWDAYKAKFAEVFGTPQNKRYTLEQLVSYGQQKWGMNLEELKAYNQRSWERRNASAPSPCRDEGEISTESEFPTGRQLPPACTLGDAPNPYSLAWQTDDIE